MGFKAVWLVLLLVTALVTEEVHGFTRQDVRGFLSNHAFVSELFSCLMNYGPCNFFTQEIKDHTHSALHGRCRGCSQDDRQLVVWTIKMARRSYPNEFQQVWRKYY